MIYNREIAIMTWYTYQNYGTALQASALYHVVDSMGYDPSFVQYPPKSGQITADRNNLAKRLYNKFYSIRNRSYESLERSRLYDEYFDNRTSSSDLCVSYSELHDLNDKYCAFICGSDQIWSPLCYDSKYFLDFVENNNKMIAYAPSFGSTEITNPIIRERIARYISRFKHLSVREQQGANLIKKLTGQDAKIVLDPTFLMDSSEWDHYIEEEKVQKLADKDYIICYFLGDSDKYIGYVRTLSKKMNVSYYMIPVTVKQKVSKEAVPFEVGPREFVSLIRNARYVCTDSLHGMAFSVNYNIPFSVFKRFKDDDPKNQNSRILSLLKILGLENRLVDYQKRKDIQTEIICDFSRANVKLGEQRKDSIEYLKSSLDRAVNSENNNANIPFKITDICCGCGACATVCSKVAITITRNLEGFEHYSIDMAKCVRCEQCKDVCPMTNISAPNMKDSQKLYSVKSYSENVLKKSSSGGVAYETAYHLLNNEYAVCGCMYDITTNSAKHIWIMPAEKEKLSLLQGSKYIQSITSDALSQISVVIKCHKIVFFGTPCQVAAVDKIIRKNGLREKAVLVDLICHGVPSYFLWKTYLNNLNEKFGTGPNPKVQFRSKEREWRRLRLVVNSNGSIYKKDEHRDDFYAFFRRGLCYMESCSDCPYRERSAADLRIGDYWGERFEKDKQGVSMVIARTKCGKNIIDLLDKNQTCQVEEHDLSEYWSVQYPYNQQRPLIREKLIEELKSGNIDLHTLRKKYCSYYDQVEKQSRIVLLVKKIVIRR